MPWPSLTRQVWEETATLAAKLQEAGVDIINTGAYVEINSCRAEIFAETRVLRAGIGWHEARVPTIATSVPRAGFSWVTRKLRGHVDVPLVATNRINTPEIAERVLSDGDADLVSMARPLLADAEFVAKAGRGDAHRINVCIACNQACLDHTFAARRASCLVNPRAGYESELVYSPTSSARAIGVVGAGPAGLAFSTVAAARGHTVSVARSRRDLGVISVQFFR